MDIMFGSFIAILLVDAAIGQLTTASQDVLTNKKCKSGLRAPCTCNEVTVRCVNVQFTDSDVFLLVGTAWPYLQEVTFIGNNFQILPSALFGKIKHIRLKSLNLTSNYIVQLDHRPFEGMPNLHVLDLSYNEIILKHNDTDMFTDIPQLRRLLLRKAFSRPSYRSRDRELESNKSQLQTQLMEQSFRLAKLTFLTDLDLSYNFLQSVHFNLTCSLPSLKRLDLSNNVLNTFNMNKTCIDGLQYLDLSGNSFKQIDMTLRILAEALPNYSLRLGRNSYFCDCNSATYIEWVRRTYKIADRNRMKCYRASPTVYERVELLNVNLTHLDCSVVFGASGAIFAYKSVLYSCILSLMVYLATDA